MSPIAPLPEISLVKMAVASPTTITARRTCATARSSVIAPTRAIRARAVAAPSVTAYHLHAQGGFLTITNTTITGNNAVIGGGISTAGGAAGGLLTVTNSTIVGNSSSSNSAGGISKDGEGSAREHQEYDRRFKHRFSRARRLWRLRLERL